MLVAFSSSHKASLSSGEQTALEIASFQEYVHDCHFDSALQANLYWFQWPEDEKRSLIKWEPIKLQGKKITLKQLNKYTESLYQSINIIWTIASPKWMESFVESAIKVKHINNTKEKQKNAETLV